MGAGTARLLVLLLSIAAGPALAETFRVRSGEHTDFSRLVVDGLPAGTAWTLGRADEAYELRLAIDTAGFDIGDVFRLIPRTRLQGLDTGAPSSLRLNVAEGNHAAAFETPSGALVIDIRSGPPPAGSRFELPIDPPPAVQTAAPAMVYRPAPAPPPRLDVFWQGGLDSEPDAAPPAPAQMPLAPSLPDPRVAQAEAELMMQLGRAAAQGLVEIDVTPSSKPASSRGGGRTAASAGEPEAEPGAGLAGPADLTGQQNPAGHLAIHAETSMDRALADEVELFGVTSNGEECLPDSVVDLASWGDARTFSEQLSDAQAGLLGEFDQPDPVAVERLVKLYLYHGFGAEARATAAAFGLPAARSDLLMTLAQILDDGHARAPGALAGMADCDGSVALWATLAEARVPPGATVDHGAVLRAFSGLPLHLRRTLGPGLVDRFVEAGAPDTARAVRDAILRAPGDHGPGLQMIDARLDLAQGDGAAAEAELAAVVEGDGPMGPEALILLIENHLRDGRPVPAALTESAGALAFEHRDAELGAALSRAHLLGLASVGQFAEASAELVRAGSRWSAEERRAVGRELLESLAAWPDDAEFLARFLADRDLFDRADPPVDLRLSVARRLLENGFAAEARQALGSGGRSVAEGRMIAAGAALQEGDAGTALALLSGMVGAEPARLQAEAHRLAGDHAAAAEAYRRAGLPEFEAAEHWRAGNWDAVRSSGTGPQRAVLAIAPAQDAGAAQVPGAEEPASLAAGRALLAASRSARNAWTTLLAEPGPPAPGGAEAAPSSSGS